MTHLTHNRQRRRAERKRMNRILGANGQPAGQAPQVTRPGQTTVSFDFKPVAGGVLFTLTLGGHVIGPLLLPADAGDQFGLCAIRAAHESRVGRGNGDPAFDDLLNEAHRNVNGNDRGAQTGDRAAEDVGDDHDIP